MSRSPGILYALLAAVFFGASTPFAKTLIGEVHPVMLAGLLYLGSGVGLMTLWCLRHWGSRSSRDKESSYLTRRDLPWFAGAVVTGGMLGPVLLMVGLATTPSSTTALLLNLEGVFTALLAWIVFRENVDRSIFFGMLLIVLGGLLLSWEQRPELGTPWGLLAITGACVCWAIDNNLTRKVSASDPLQIAGIKGLASGTMNVALAWAIGAHWPGIANAAPAAVVGFLGYGVSLVFFVLALRHLGTARTGAYFSAAPIVGVVLSLVLLNESPGLLFWLGFAAMTAGLWLHITERHEHSHTHEPIAHRHPHVHDAHHQHEHGFEWDGTEPHTHEHAHRVTTHSHPHYPDIHHRHEHQQSS